MRRLQQKHAALEAEVSVLKQKLETEIKVQLSFILLIHPHHSLPVTDGVSYVVLHRMKRLSPRPVRRPGQRRRSCRKSWIKVRRSSVNSGRDSLTLRQNFTLPNKGKEETNPDS